MKLALDKYLAFSDLTITEFAEIIGESRPRVVNWIERQSPIYVEFVFNEQVQSQEVPVKVTSERVIYTKESDEDKRSPDEDEVMG